MRRTGGRNRIYNGAEDGYTRSKGTGHCVLFFLLFLYYCDTVDRISLSADVTAAVVDAASCGTFAAGGQFTITAAYTYAPAGKISIFDYSQIIFATLLGFLLFAEIPDRYSLIGYGLIILASLGNFLYNWKHKD